MKRKLPVIEPAPLETRIVTVRGEKVILDLDLAELYAVTTKALNQAVKRNAERFPSDFAFSLSVAEKAEVVTNCDHLARLKFSPGLPRAFTEHGALMAANVLNDSRAAAISLYIVRAFVKMREEHAANAAILKRLAEIDKTLLLHDGALRDIYQKLRPATGATASATETPNRFPRERRRRPISYRPPLAQIQIRKSQIANHRPPMRIAGLRHGVVQRRISPIPPGMF